MIPLIVCDNYLCDVREHCFCWQNEQIIRKKIIESQNRLSYRDFSVIPSRHKPATKGPCQDFQYEELTIEEYAKTMDRAEQRALEAYPVKFGTIHEPDIHYEADLNLAARQKYIQGYHQAEKDLALTPEDVVVITTLYECGRVRGWTIEEVLRRFNEQRKK